jgi:hypothetical protein
MCSQHQGAGRSFGTAEVGGGGSEDFGAGKVAGMRGGPGWCRARRGRGESRKQAVQGQLPSSQQGGHGWKSQLKAGGGGTGEGSEGSEGKDCQQNDGGRKPAAASEVGASCEREDDRGHR